MELNARIGVRRKGRAKIGWADKNLMGEGSCRRLGFRVSAMTNRAALHENDGVVTVLARHSGRQTRDELRFGAADGKFKAPRRDMMAFIHDDMAVVRHAIIHHIVANQARISATSSPPVSFFARHPGVQWRQSEHRETRTAAQPTAPKVAGDEPIRAY